MVAWPDGVNDWPLRRGYSESPAETTLRTEMDEGTARVRREHGAGTPTLRARYPMSGAEVEIWDAWFVADLAGGSLPFSVAHPRTRGQGTFRIVGEPRYDSAGPDRFVVSLELEQLPVGVQVRGAGEIVVDYPRIEGLADNAGVSGNLLLARQFAGAASLADATTVGSATIFDRDSPGWRWNPSGVFVEEATDAPRLEHDPVTLAALGLLGEEGKTFIAAQDSEDIGGANWLKQNVAQTANVSVAPDGNTAMDRITTNNGAATYRARTYNDVNASASLRTFAVFAKYGNYPYLKQSPHKGSIATASVVYDLQNKVIFGVGSTTGGRVDHGIRHVGNDTCLCWVTAPCNSSAPGQNLGMSDYLGTSDSGDTEAFAGDEYVDLWGAYVTDGMIGSYYPSGTGAPSTLRAADTATVEVVSGDVGTYYVSARTPLYVPLSGTVQIVAQIDDGTDDNRIVIERQDDSHIHVRVIDGGVERADLDLGLVANQTDFAVCVGWADGDYSASLDGATLVSGGSGDAPDGLDTVRLWTNVAGDSYWNSTVAADLLLDQKEASATIELLAA